MELADDKMCFACGQRNPIGLKLHFELDGERYITRFTPKQEHQGYVGMTHGGIVSTVLDEVMARLVSVRGYDAPTAELVVRFKRPAVTGQELTFTGWVVGERGRVIDCAAEARDATGILVAEATARMMKVRHER